MKYLFFALLLSVSIAVTAQVPEKLPATKEEFISSEKDFINAAKWLETTAIGTDMDTRMKVNAWVLAWLTNSPTVTVEVRSSILKAFDKNAQLSLVFMAAYGRYCLENNYSKEEVKCNTAGIKAVINCYNLGGAVKNDKGLNKVIEKDKEGKLEEWVKDAMKAK
jgi:hypothetical protein